MTSSSPACTTSSNSDIPTTNTAPPSYTILPGCSKEPDCIMFQLDIDPENKIFYTIDHATQAHVDALTQEEIEPLDPTVTLPIVEEKQKGEEEEEEEEKLNEQTESKQDDKDDNQQEESKKTTEVKTDESKTSTSPIAAVSTKQKPHQVCYLLKGEATSKNLSAVGVNIAPFHVAALVGNITALRNYVKKYGVDAIKTLTDDDRSIVEVAIRSNNLEVVKFFAEECKISFHHVNKFQVTPLMISVFLKSEKADAINKYILDYFTAEELNINYYSTNTDPPTGSNALSWAIYGENLELVDILVSDKFKATLSPLFPIPLLLETLCAGGKVEVINFILEKGIVKLDWDHSPMTSTMVKSPSSTSATVNRSNAISVHHHPLVLPCLAPNAETANTLFDVMKPFYLKQKFSGEPAETNPARKNDVTPMHYAARSGFVEVMKKLIEMENEQEENETRTAAAAADSKSSSSSLVLNAQSTMVGTPFMFACTPLGLKAVHFMLNNDLVDLQESDNFVMTIMLRCLYWDNVLQRQLSGVAAEDQLIPYISAAETVFDMFDLIRRLLKERKISPNARQIPTELAKKHASDVQEHNRKNRRSQHQQQKFSSTHGYLWQRTVYQPPITSPTCCLPTAMMLIDFGADYCNPQNTSTHGNKSHFFSRLHELKCHWMRYMFNLFNYSSDDSTSSDLTKHSFPITVFQGCEVVLNNDARLEIEEAENLRIPTMTLEQKRAFAEQRTKKPPIGRKYVDNKKLQILTTYRYYKMMTSTWGQVEGYLGSGRGGGAGGCAGALFSYEGFILGLLSDKLSMWFIGLMHGRLGWLRNSSRW